MNNLMQHYGEVLARATHAALAFHHVTWGVSADAPSTFAEAVASYRLNNQIVIVWNGASDKTIYPTPFDNWAARAWHDFHHVMGDHDFSEAGELATMRAQMADIDALAAAGELSGVDAAICKALLECEVKGQLDYKAKHGEFPSDQRAFAYEWMTAS